MRWFTEADISIAEDDELLGLMRDAGCKQVLIGLESPRKSSLDGVELNANWKLKQQEHYLQAIAKIQAHGIRVIGCFILGLDGDTPEVFGDVRRFAKESSLADVQITFLTAFPGTPLYHRLKQEGRIIRDQAWELCTLFDPNIRPKNMSLQELQSGFLGLAEALYSTQATQARQQKFKALLRASPSFGRKSHRAKKR